MKSLSKETTGFIVILRMRPLGHLSLHRSNQTLTEESGLCCQRCPISPAA
jgi:hypothetical protein